MRMMMGVRERGRGLVYMRFQDVAHAQAIDRKTHEFRFPKVKIGARTSNWNCGYSVRCLNVGYPENKRYLQLSLDGSKVIHSHMLQQNKKKQCACKTGAEYFTECLDVCHFDAVGTTEARSRLESRSN